MSPAEIFIVLVATLSVMIYFFFNMRKRIARRRSRDMAFLRVLIARKDSDLDEKRETVKDFREQISIMEQLFASMKSLYMGNFSGWLF